jgi:hypothetical protein
MPSQRHETWRAWARQCVLDSVAVTKPIGNKMRRRAAHQAQPQAPIKILWAMPGSPRAQAGCCPKCGKLVGQRLLRAHDKTCKGKPSES